MGNKKCNPRCLYFPERLQGVMDEILNYPLTIVEAPMGYGKTTAIREHFNDTDAYVLWYRIHDNNTAGFWNGFCRQLGELDDIRSQQLIRLGFPNDSVSLLEALKIIDDIKFPEKTVLVIDDYHLIDSQYVNRFMEFLVRDEITNMHLVLTVRFTEFQSIEELKLKGYLYHITKETFEFTLKEISEYYKLCGISLEETDAEKLYSMSEGWISALYLIMLDYIAEGAYPRITNIYKLIEKAVYESFTEEVRNFLVIMCIFDSFTLDQAVHMWGKANTEGILKNITNKNAFVNYDLKTKNYHMHKLLVNFLKGELESKNIKLNLYHNAAIWFLQISDYEQAMHYFYLCNDFDSIFMTIEKEKAAIKNPAYKKELTIRYLTQCPEAVKAKYPFAMLLLAFRLFTFNEIDLFQSTCEVFMRNIQIDNSLDKKSKDTLLGEFEMVLSFTGYNDIYKMGQHYRKATNLMTEPSRIMLPNSIWTFGSPSVLYMFYRESGQLTENIDSMMEFIPIYNRLASGNGVGAEHLMDAERHFYSGDLDDAEILMHQAMYEAQSKDQTAIKFSILFLEMRIELMRGNYSFIVETLQRMRDEIANSGEYLLIYTTEICEGYLFSLLNQDKKIPKWFKSGEFKNYRLLFPVFAMLNIVYGRFLLIRGDYLKIIGSIAHFIGIASVFPNLLGQIYTYIYCAAANYRISKQDDAVAALRQALDIAMPDKLYMPFVENCDYIKPLLEELYGQGICREGIKKILNLYESYQKSVEQITMGYLSEKKPELTKRETQIARLAAEGFSNRDIGEQLFISENTVKTQLKSIFYKLGINSRVLLKVKFFEKM